MTVAIPSKHRFIVVKYMKMLKRAVEVTSSKLHLKATVFTLYSSFNAKKNYFNFLPEVSHPDIISCIREMEGKPKS